MATSWQQSLMGLLGAPYNGITLRACNDWAASEGMPGYAHNWFATSLKTTGWRQPDPPFDEPFYNNLATGLYATANSIKNSRYGYPAILAAFRAGNSLEAIWAAINASTWCRGCSAGKYPAVMYDDLTSPVTLTQRIVTTPQQIVTPHYTLNNGITNTVWEELEGWVMVGSVQVQNALSWAEDVLSLI
jgi:hypothetical protein